MFVFVLYFVLECLVYGCFDLISGLEMGKSSPLWGICFWKVHLVFFNVHLWGFDVFM